MAPKLTIGIMVKNQTKELRECLSRLEETRAKIETEVIVHVDDSSTENTYELAKEFTDNVEYFKWVNNYSTIKNGIMDKATGDWIWILDADEFACDTSDLIRFINSEEANDYTFLQYYEKNYYDKRKKTFMLQRPLRIYKRSANHRYINAVHEAVKNDGSPIKQIEMTVEHVGYIGFLKSEKRKIRQVQVKAEYDKNPKELRNVVLYADTFSGVEKKEVDECCKMLEKAIKIAKKGPESTFRGVVYYKLAQLRCSQVQTKQAEEVLAAYEKTLKGSTYSLGEIYCLLAKHFFDRQLYEQAIEYFEKYFKVYKKVEYKTIIDIDQHIDYYNELIQDSVYVKDNIAKYAIALAKTQQIDKAKELISSKELIEYKGEELCKAYVVISQEACNAEMLTAKYLEFAKEEEKNYSKSEVKPLDCLRNSIEFVLTRSSLKIVDLKIIEALSDLRKQLPDDIYIRFNFLRSNGPFDTAQDTVQELAAINDTWAEYAFGFILNRILEDKIPLSLVASGNAVNKLSLASGLAYQLNLNYKKRQEEYFEAFPDSKKLQELRIKKEMLTPIVRAEIAEGGISLEVFKEYFSTLSEYAFRVVPLELQEEDNINCVFHELQLGIKMYKAGNAKAEGKQIEYVRYLKEIIRLEASMAAPVSMLMEEIEGNLEEPSKAQKEMDILAQGVKTMLYQLIEKKDKTNALTIFNQLQSIVPKDKDLPQIAIKINNI